MVTRDYESPLGRIVMCAAGSALVSLQFDDQECAGSADKLRDPDGTTENAVLDAAAAWLDRYFRSELPGPTPPLHPVGTAFQRKVWALTAEIPYGGTRSYGALAKTLQSAPRAVGGALGKNPILLMIPCHRVLGANGSLTGFTAGLARKRTLLALENPQ